jgi:hypothetical protein
VHVEVDRGAGRWSTPAPSTDRSRQSGREFFERRNIGQACQKLEYACKIDIWCLSVTLSLRPLGSRWSWPYSYGHNHGHTDISFDAT